MALGHRIEPLTLAIDPRQVYGAHGAVGAAALLAAVRDREAALDRPLRDDELQPLSHYLVHNATSATAENLYRARRDFERVGSRMERVFDDYDILLSPVAPSYTAIAQLVIPERRATMIAIYNFAIMALGGGGGAGRWPLVC